ncbi:MAG: hypothetical protein HYR97_07980 [Candidatus Melainabacteria bacterium]|nr:hypothetical protein [Candidatus Melainabacteria bacterium]MBI3308188.1 hypothetical protein [Candidatus Melainabacteria bacterium]
MNNTQTGYQLYLSQQYALKNYNPNVNPYYGLGSSDPNSILEAKFTERSPYHHGWGRGGMYGSYERQIDQLEHYFNPLHRWNGHVPEGLGELNGLGGMFGDGSNDISLLMKVAGRGSFVNQQRLSQGQFLASDINNDGKISPRDVDALMVLRGMQVGGTGDRTGIGGYADYRGALDNSMKDYAIGRRASLSMHRGPFQFNNRMYSSYEDLRKEDEQYHSQYQNGREWNPIEKDMFTRLQNLRQNDPHNSNPNYMTSNYSGIKDIIGEIRRQSEGYPYTTYANGFNPTYSFSP